ncbi:MAG: polyamine ABC transporter substrate-binding protein [Ilumatobacteraceae bacterium]|jgi:spermidine/putrescine transport system substrate-binding protein
MTNQQFRPMGRRDFLRNLAITSGAITFGGSLLAACGGSTETESGGLSIGTPQSPIKLPVTTDAIADGLPNESGTLEILNWADYQNPESIAIFEEKFGCKVVTSIYDTEEAAIAKLRNGTFKPDLILGMTDTGLAKLIAADLLQPLNKSYIPNFGNVISGLQNPYYDLGSQYTVPYFIYGNGIGYRTDRIDKNAFEGNGYDILWDSQFNGKVGVLDSYRDTLAMAMFRAGNFDGNTVDAAIIQKAGDDLIAMREATNPKVDILAYTEIPSGNRDINFTWSGDLFTALQYLPEGVAPDVLGFWYPEKTVTKNDFMCIAKSAKAPVLAHQLINFLSDTDNALLNREYVGYQPALESITVDLLISSGTIPESLTDALVTPEKYKAGLAQVSLEPAVDALWLEQWTRFTAG